LLLYALFTVTIFVTFTVSHNSYEYSDNHLSLQLANVFVQLQEIPGKPRNQQAVQ